MPPLLLLLAALSAGVQGDRAIPVRVGNAQINPVDFPSDLAVTYEFVNDAVDVTAYEVSITRHFADGSTLVSTQGQDWFSSSGYSFIRAGVYSLIGAWLPRYPAGEPGTNVHLLRSPPATKAPLIEADVSVTAVIRLDGTAVGSRRVIDRIFAERRAMLSEHAYWVPRLQRGALMEDPIAGLAWLARALATPRRKEILSGPRECLRLAVEAAVRWSQEQPAEASRALDTLSKIAAQQHQFLVEQSVWKR